MSKVEDHINAIRRRCDEAQEFIGLANAYSHGPVDYNLIEAVESNLAEARAIIYSAMQEMKEIRSYLGMGER